MPSRLVSGCGSRIAEATLPAKQATLKLGHHREERLWQDADREGGGEAPLVTRLEGDIEQPREDEDGCGVRLRRVASG